MAKLATRDAYGKTLVELGKQDPNIVVLDADLSCSTKTAMFRDQFPKRFFNVGVAEQDMIGIAAGLATTGKTVFASTFAVFGSGRAWDQIRVSLAYPRLNVKVVVTHGGITTGEDGVTHQAMEDIAIMRALPNMTVIVPADAIETKKVIHAAAAAQGPFYVRLSRPATELVYENENYDFTIGRGIKLKDGHDVTVVACGIMVKMALDAAEALKKEGISVRVINIHTIKPLDKEILFEAARETKAIVVAEEHSIIGGLGGAVAELVAENYPILVRRIGMKDMFAESGTPDALLEKYGLTSFNVAQTCREILDDAKKL